MIKARTEALFPANLKTLIVFANAVATWNVFINEKILQEFLLWILSCSPSLILLFSRSYLVVRSGKLFRETNYFLFKIRFKQKLSNYQYLRFRSINKRYSSTGSMNFTAKEFYSKPFHEIVLYKNGLKQKFSLCNLRNKEDATKIMEILVLNYGMKVV